MKIQEFEIRNYKSLLDVKFELGDFTVLIGENGSGKTNILEILYLFFNDFDLIGGPASPMLHNLSSWHRRRQQKPIEISMKIKLEEEECKDIFSEEILNKIKEKHRDMYKEITFHRQITKPGEPWRTKHVKIGDTFFVKEDKLVLPGVITESLIGKISKPPKVYLFDPKANQTNLVGDRLIVLDNKAYFMNEELDKLVSQGKIPFEHLPGTEYKKWAEENKLTLLKTPPTKEEISKLKMQLFLTPEILQQIRKNLTEKIKGKFNLVPATRDVRISPGERKSFLDGEAIIKPLHELPKSGAPLDDEKWAKINELIEDLVGKRLNAIRPELST